LPYNTRVKMVDLKNATFYNVVEMGSMQWDQPLSPVANVPHYTIDLERFGSSYGERIKAGYLPNTQTLYIDILTPFYPSMVHSYHEELRKQYQPSTQRRPLVWHKNPNESIWVYGDRMFKTNGDSAYIDNPRKRKEYQKAVFKSIYNLITRNS